MKPVKFHIFPLVSYMVEDASKTFAPMWSINNDKRKLLKLLCSTIDDMSYTLHQEDPRVDIEISEKHKNVILDLVCKDGLTAHFVFEGLWEKSSKL